MYKLSEQPIKTIVEEMKDFSSLKKIGIFTVKEKFNEKDTYYEVGDLVAIYGQNADEISIVPYDKLKEFSSYMLADDTELKKLFVGYHSMTISKFHEKFELSEPETDKIEAIMKEIKTIVNEEKEELAKKKDIDYQSYGFMLLLFPIVGLVCIFFADAGFWGYVIGGISGFIGFILWGRLLLRGLKNMKINKDLLNKLSDLDNRRIAEGMYNKSKGV